MRFWTIWTIPAMTLRERLSRTREWANREVAHRLPKRLRYWVTMDSAVRTGLPPYEINFENIMEAVEK